MKGVTWDPVGQFLATQSDDRTVKIWNTEDWSLVEEIKKPFEKSPANTFFRRLSWSPDGSFIATSNAMNGPVFVAAIIDRYDWSTDISFVGHENTIQVAAFNPRIFFPPGEKKTRAKASCMLALGSDDSSISIWRNTRNKPLLVVKDIFERQILDLCWYVPVLLPIASFLPFLIGQMTDIPSMDALLMAQFAPFTSKTSKYRISRPWKTRT